MGLRQYFDQGLGTHPGGQFAHSARFHNPEVSCLKIIFACKAVWGHARPLQLTDGQTLWNAKHSHMSILHSYPILISLGFFAALCWQINSSFMSTLLTNGKHPLCFDTNLSARISAKLGYNLWARSSLGLHSGSNIGSNPWAVYLSQKPTYFWKRSAKWCLVCSKLLT